MSEDGKNLSYRDLLVWQASMELATNCYVLTKSYPRDERYGLTSQIRRAASSVAANIAEGHGRETPRVFIQFLRIAQGSLRELETHLLLSERVGLSDEQQTRQLLSTSDEIGKMLRGLIRSIQKKSQ